MSRRTKEQSGSRKVSKAVVEAFESRSLLTIFNVGAGDTAWLTAAINNANDKSTNPGADTIVLDKPT